MKQEIESIIIKYLQNKLTFSIDKKVVKTGKLILFNIKDFYMNFTLKDVNNCTKHYSIPYPFSIKESTNKTISLIYNLDILAKNNHELLYKMKLLSKKKNSKLYNSTIVVSIE